MRETTVGVDGYDVERPVGVVDRAGVQCDYVAVLDCD